MSRLFFLSFRPVRLAPLASLALGGLYLLTTAVMGQTKTPQGDLTDIWHGVQLAGAYSSQTRFLAETWFVRPNNSD